MGMVLNTNMSALAAHNNLRKTQSTVDTALERLSSGLRINRAADDAAGLAISESLRSQANGSVQAMRNAQDAISLIQTAEGALNETHTMLQRIRNLAVQAANDTLTLEDRMYVQKEVEQLVRQITKNAETTTFNTMPVLDGTFRDKVFQIGANVGAVTDLSIANMDGKSLGLEVPFGWAPKAHQLLEGTDDLPADPNVLPLHPNGTIHARTPAENISTEDYLALLNSGGATFDPATDGWTHVMIPEFNDPLDPAVQTGEHWGGQWEKDVDGDPATPTIKSYNPPDPFNAPQRYFQNNPTAGGLRDRYRATWTQTVAHMDKAEAEHQVLSANPHLHPYDNQVPQEPARIATKMPENEPHTFGTISDGIYRIDNDVVYDGRGEVVGSYNDAEFKLSFSPVDYAVFDKSLYTRDWHRPELRQGTVTVSNIIQVTSHDLASHALGVVDAAISKVSEQRASLGAIQNRLEHTVNNLGVTAENLQAAESRIRDADMAKEMTALSRGQILQQAGISMLAQANQAPQQMLKLLG